MYDSEFETQENNFFTNLDKNWITTYINYLNKEDNYRIIVMKSEDIMWYTNYYAKETYIVFPIVTNKLISTLKW